MFFTFIKIPQEFIREARLHEYNGNGMALLEDMNELGRHLKLSGGVLGSISGVLISTDSTSRMIKEGFAFDRIHALININMLSRDLYRVRV